MKKQRVTVSEDRANQYLGERYGQSPEARAKYGDAIIACSSIEHLGLTISGIARMYGVDAEGLRNQLKRHFPNVIPLRDKLRGHMGYHVHPRAGVQPETAEQYAGALQLLRETDLTTKEVADQCGVSFQGLQQYVLFYHKDIAEKRLGRRLAALDKNLDWGEKNCNNHRTGPSAAIRERYAPAVEMMWTTDLPLTEIAHRCGVDDRGFRGYVQKWCRGLILSRQEKRRTEMEVRRAASLLRKKESKAERASRIYTPTVEMIRGGMNLSEAATAVGADVSNLSAWMKKHHPEVLDQARVGMMKLDSGKMTCKSTYVRFRPVAEYMKLHLSESSKSVAQRFGIPISSMQKALTNLFPDVWKAHMDACAKVCQLEKTKREELIRAALDEYVEGRATLQELALRCGVSAKTLRNWRKKMKG